ncbi:MAG TPA: benzoyl-CoA 2,3-epoxidase subunit BoxA [Nevskiaceae bacterium]|nr:benzoyl-CoA 2,3-epoxidase subunit BoxA [Nevskiaceae bacterium]
MADSSPLHDAPAGAIRQHLIDPEICIRCGACEAACPINAITHNDLNYVVNPDVCEGCMACIPGCPTGAIDNWILTLAARAHPVDDQLTWESLPPAWTLDQLVAEGVAEATKGPAPEGPQKAAVEAVIQAQPEPAAGDVTFTSANYNASLPPWSAAHAFTNLYPVGQPTTATVVGNFNCTKAGYASETHHVMLDFGTMPFPILEGQSIGIVPPGTDDKGRAYVARQYSVASPRNGERPGYNNVSLTVKRVDVDHAGKPVRGVASNYLCDLQIGDAVKVIGPFGNSFLMPNHPKSNIVMICTGAGSAPMRAMTEWRRRLRKSGKFEGGRLMLFFGARTQQELPYFGPLTSLPKDFIDVNLAFSRTPGQPKRYVQDLMRERSADLAALLKDAGTSIFVCGLKAMDEGVLHALADVATDNGLNWDTLAAAFKREGRLHLETY